MDLEKDSGSKDKWNRQRKKRGDAGRRGGARKEECRERMRLRGGARQSPVQQHTLVLPLLKSCLLD